MVPQGENTGKPISAEASLRPCFSILRCDLCIAGVCRYRARFVFNVEEAKYYGCAVGATPDLAPGAARRTGCGCVTFPDLTTNKPPCRRPPRLRADEGTGRALGTFATEEEAARRWCETDEWRDAARTGSLTAEDGHGLVLSSCS